MAKWLKWISILIVLSISIIIIILHGVEPFMRGDDNYLTELSENTGMSFKYDYKAFRGDSLRYISCGNTASDTIILFFHGAPGSWMDFSSFLADSLLAANAMMIAMDRPGYGYSRYGRIESDISQQTIMAKSIMETLPPKNILLVGYSYGGPVAASFAARYPEKLIGLILLAPVVDPEGERLFWFNKLLDINMIRHLFPTYIIAANDEKLIHAKALDDMRYEWSEIQCPVVHMHCTDDWIAPHDVNVQWTKSQIPTHLYQLISWEGDNHFLPNHVSEKILPVIYQMLKII